MQGSTIISAGLGEDGSFDLEFARKYDANIIIVDPTPRSIDYFSHLVSLDNNKDIAKKLHLVDSALWNDVGEVNFYTPPDKLHVSHSIINFQNDYATDTDHIKVSSTTIDRIISDFELDVNNLAMLKLDIEGAEIEVLEDMLKKRIFPKQILVEFDELNIVSNSGASRISMVHELLIRNEYRIVHSKGSDFCYLRKKCT
ncbi:FkbM family methyltransferase [Planktomarina temperata]|nr:FkbM family methyltransferase [Planktomarina temperata]